MLKFISKEQVWAAMDKGHHTTLGWEPVQYHLKTWQDVVVFDRIAGSQGKTVGETGGGRSRILKALSARNDCYNVDKFAGQHGGPKGEYTLPGVTNIVAFLGDFSPDLPSSFFDIVFSVSVVEHVPDAGAQAFMDDLVRALKPGALSIHAIDMYIGAGPLAGSQKRLDLYRSWLERPDIEPLGPVTAEKAVFAPWMASNPDQTMWQWNRSVPQLREMRSKTQSASLLLGF